MHYIDSEPFVMLTSPLNVVVNPEAMATSGKTDKSPHDQEIKFFAKVWNIDMMLNLLLNSFK